MMEVLTTLTESSSRYFFLYYNDGNINTAVVTNTAKTKITGFLISSFNGGLEFTVKKPKSYSGKIYYVSSTGDLQNLLISGNGDLLGVRKISVSDLPAKVEDYWVYGSRTFLYLSNKQIVQVR